MKMAMSRRARVSLYAVLLSVLLVLVLWLFHAVALTGFLHPANSSTTHQGHHQAVAPPVAPKRITYVTVGNPSPWKPGVGGGGPVVEVRKPELDTHLAFYTQTHTRFYHHLLLDLQEHLAPTRMNESIVQLTSNLTLLDNQTLELVKEWAKLSRNSVRVEQPIIDSLRQLHLLLHKPDPTGHMITCNSCFKYSFNTVLSPRRSCSQGQWLVVMVTSEAKAYEERKSVRETWGKWAQGNTTEVQLIFLIGIGGGRWPIRTKQHIDYEHELFGDILQMDYVDHHYNLSYKVVSGMKWVVDTCPQARFIMRTSSSNFVHVPNVLQLLQRYGHERALQDHQIGRCIVNLPPYRWLDHSTFISTDEYDLDTFPPHALGGTYLVSMKLAQEMLGKVAHVAYLSKEDAYMGVVLWEMGRGCHDVEGFIQQEEGKTVPLHLVNREVYFSQHPLSPEQMYEVYRRARTRVERLTETRTHIQ